MDPDTRQQAIDLYDRFTHEGMDRRVFMSRMVAIAGSVAAAEALVAAIAASPAAAAVVPADDPRLTTREQRFGNGYSAYVAEPRTRSLKPSVLVIHENRGLNDHIRDVARRAALVGYRAVAPDLLSPVGGTPSNEDAAREAIGKLDIGAAVSAGVELVDELAQSSAGSKVGAVGFCWGGAFVNRLAVAAGDKVAAVVPFYGPAPDPAEASKVAAPMQFQLAGLDKRVAQTAWPWISALGSEGKPIEAFVYPGVNHAFHNDTSAERYDKAAATLAWGRTLDFFKRYLA
ncbi:MAG TPA: dienelactone hydrolase family protein [Sphingomicrobium sp.]|jgi:carboxymethylenebutenolidase|nr:dienelactone hydrolase family protein [Sphingomicrobium sp.]